MNQTYPDRAQTVRQIAAILAAAATITPVEFRVMDAPAYFLSAWTALNVIPIEP
jgi:hypothetical protein